MPSVARMYDYYLGGKDNYAVDRGACRQLSAQAPSTEVLARNNRRFLQRVVRTLAQEYGIRQFLDHGSGQPTQDNVHQIVQRVDADSRVVYVDNDPIVLAHGRALLEENDNTAFIKADMRDVEGVVNHEQTRRLINFDEPVAVLFVSVLHCIPDSDDPVGLIRTIASKLASGSYLVICQLVSELREAPVSPLTPKGRAEAKEELDQLTAAESALVGPLATSDTSGEGLSARTPRSVSLDTLATIFVPAVNNNGSNRNKAELVRLLLRLPDEQGVLPDIGVWPRQKDVAEALGLSAGRIPQILKEERKRWKQSPAVQALRAEILELLGRMGRVASAVEIADALAVRRGTQLTGDAVAIGVVLGGLLRIDEEVHSAFS